MIRTLILSAGMVPLIFGCGDGRDVCINCLDSATCDPGAPQACVCPDGSMGDGQKSGTGCTNIDECAAGTDDCVAVATCSDTPGSFTCTCNSGYQGDGKMSGTGCADIDECVAATHDCDPYARCDNTIGGFECRGLYATSPSENLAWRLDPATWEALLTIAPTLAGSTVIGTTALATDPTTNAVYGIARVTGGGRLLTTVDTQTMAYTSVGSLGDRFSSLTFDSSGQLFGVTGDGAVVRETLYTIDKASAARTLAVALGNGADGEVIAYNPTDRFIYHWSGNSALVFEKFPATPPYTPVTDIAISGSPNGETFGAWFDPAASDFVAFNRNSQVVRASTTGAYTGPVGATLPGQLRSPAYGFTHPQRVVPAVGSVAGGYTVQLRSHGFSQLAGTPAVTFNGVAATNVTIDSDTQLTVTVPAGSPGSVTVRATDEGTPAHVFAWPAGFTYTSPFASQR